MKSFQLLGGARCRDSVEDMPRPSGMEGGSRISLGYHAIQPPISFDGARRVCPQCSFVDLVDLVDARPNAAGGNGPGKHKPMHAKWIVSLASKTLRMSLGRVEMFIVLRERVPGVAHDPCQARACAA